MAERRQPFRFRLPWVSAAPAARRPTESLPPRPTTETQSPAQPTTTESKVSLQPASLSQPPSQTRDNSSMPSPSRTTQSREASVPHSPSRTGPQSQASSLRPSSTRTASKSQPAAQHRSPTPLASEHAGQTLQTTAQDSTGLTQNITHPALLASQQEKPTVAVPKPESQESQSEKELQSDSISNSQEYIQVKSTSEPDSEKLQINQVSANEQKAAAPSTEAIKTTSPNQKKKSISIRDNPNPVSETQSNFHETGQEEENAVRETMKVQRTEDQEIGKPMQSSTAESNTASASGTKPKDLLTMAFQAEKNQHDAAKTFDRKDISIPGGKENKIVRSTSPVNRDISSISHQKPVVSNGEGVPLQKEIKEDISNFFHKLAAGNSLLPMDDKPVSVVTLAGDNRGATMHIGSESAKKEESVHIYRAYKVNPDESPDMTTDEEGSFRKGSKESNKEDKLPRTYVNNNIQNVNNSIMFDSSITGENPGVHLFLPHTPAESIRLNEKPAVIETRKAEFNITPAEKLTYQTNVRRRCLRGLFLESSDSDQDNPEKPRRHGCRYNCVEKKKEKGNGIL
ncbi:proteoglycan 4 [Quillaja saponaria]|uniref:Proteoglycan 4 n=1 Tax=Quillaja saponaria TaxID=32244 RepID=A0AAD7LYX4_QUISA|nr:proteoglycan 4 [Quillaja saponaria]